MSMHYSDFEKKAVSADAITFDKINEHDKILISGLRKENLKKNTGFLILLFVVLIIVLWMVISFIVSHLTTISLPNSPGSFFQVVTLLFYGIIIFGCVYFIIDLIGLYKGIRKGVLLASSRVNDGKVHEYIFDIYMEDKDETLMRYTVRKDVYEQVTPGDGVLLLKTARKIEVLSDPGRKGVMDVSNIKSGI